MCVYVYICSVYVYSGLGVYVVDFVDFLRLLSCSMLLLRFSSTIYLSIRHCGSRSSKSRGEWTQTEPLEINNRSSCCKLGRCKILSWLGSLVWSHLLALSPNRRGRLKCTTVKYIRAICRASLTGRCTPSSWRKWSSSLESQKPTWAFPERTWQWKTTWVAPSVFGRSRIQPCIPGNLQARSACEKAAVALRNSTTCVHWIMLKKKTPLLFTFPACSFSASQPDSEIGRIWNTDWPGIGGITPDIVMHCVYAAYTQCLHACWAIPRKCSPAKRRQRIFERCLFTSVTVFQWEGGKIILIIIY